MIRDECEIFEDFNILEMNKKLHTKTIEDVIEEITGKDIEIHEDNVVDSENCDDTAKALLLEQYKEF
jgi:hypothetical protein